MKPLQLGKYAEYYVKMEFTRLGFQVYSPEVDDRGIDFVVRSGDGVFLEVQVKSCRGLNYIFFPKSKFHLRDHLIGAVVLFLEKEPPNLFLVPASAWQSTDDLLVSHDYEGKKSDPEWGLNISKKNMPLLERFCFETTVSELILDV